MNRKELHEKIEARKKLAQDRRILQKVLDLLQDPSISKHRQEERSDHTLLEMDFSYADFKIKSCNYVYGPDYLSITYRDQLVFDVDWDIAPSRDTYIVSYRKFLPGSWMDSLDALDKKSIRKFREQEAQRLSNEEKEAEIIVLATPQELADAKERFGI